MNLIVIHNPTAGGGDWGADHVDRLLRGAGHAPQIESSEENWWHALREQPDAFVVAGGDGTVHKVVHALAGRDVPIAILPTGTANNVAHAFGYNTSDDLAHRVANWPNNEKLLHLALVERDGEQRLFLESVGVGVFADMVRIPDTRTVKSRADIALPEIRNHLARQLLSAKPVAVTASIDGITVTGAYLLLECLNLPYYGPRLPLAPGESSDAAMVTLCGVPVDRREEVARWIRAGVGDTRDLLLGRGLSVAIAADALAHVDGSPWLEPRGRHLPLRVSAGAHSIRIWV